MLEYLDHETLAFNIPLDVLIPYQGSTDPRTQLLREASRRMDIRPHGFYHYTLSLYNPQLAQGRTLLFDMRTSTITRYKHYIVPYELEHMKKLVPSTSGVIWASNSFRCSSDLVELHSDGIIYYYRNSHTPPLLSPYSDFVEVVKRGLLVMGRRRNGTAWITTIREWMWQMVPE